ncbi:26 kDa periplasmic immunogenic protein [Thermoflexales bacterium]|nr:26 kDa periplasmic immunogenic protein [Thermoflexales bacterium]
MPFKNRSLLVVVSFALILSFFATRPNLTVTPALAAGDDCDGSRTIQVSGSATVKVIPDLVTIQLGVTSNATTPQGVYDQNTAAMKKTVAAIRALGVADKDISTDYYIINPVYQDYNDLDIKGYRINNTIIVNLKDVSKVSQVLTVALSAGANEVVDVQFKTSQLRKYRDQARDLAVKAAQEKARDLASAANAQPGCVLNIDENSSSYYGYPWQSARYQAMSQNVMQNASSSDQPPSEDGPISLGQISVRAEVQVRFSLK